MLFHEHEFRDRFAAAKRAGFSAVEILHPYAEPIETLKDRLAQYKLECVLINNPFAPQSRDFGCGAIPGREEDFFAKIDLALSYARALNVPSIHVMAGDAPRNKKNTEIFVNNLKAAGKSAAEVGIKLLIEPLNPRDRPNYFLRYTDQAADIIEQVGLDSVRMQFDIYHTQIAEGDLTRRIERFAPLIGHVQIAGVPSRAEPDDGEINIAAIFDALGSVHYSGFVGCEYNPRGRTEDGLGWMKPYLKSAA